MTIYTVRVNGQSIKKFTNVEDAKKFMVNFTYWQSGERLRLALIDDAVLKSDMSDAKQVLTYIMEK
jgi:hypothetical protein